LAILARLAWAWLLSSPGLALLWPPRGRFLSAARCLDGDPQAADGVFDVYATVVWQLWVLGQQSGIDGQRGRASLGLLVLCRWRAGTLWACACTFLAALHAPVHCHCWVLGHQHIIKPLKSATAAASTDRWQTWEPGRVDQLNAQGQSVSWTSPR
jgi:hypothetical protein